MMKPKRKCFLVVLRNMLISHQFFRHCLYGEITILIMDMWAKGCCLIGNNDSECCKSLCDAVIIFCRYVEHSFNSLLLTDSQSAVLGQVGRQ